ncbi:MAG: DUF2066 domain-containing protein [Gammaproteobacteria bacterium]|nr:DUF2066 domain-containing protein [Gammaproteobacteria bacterium]
MKIRINDAKIFVFIATILSIMAILPISRVNADVVNHLYEAELPVQTQSREERALVVREALKEIMVRVSGRNSASALALDETLVPSPTRFVQQFRYQKYGPNEVIPVAPDGAKPYTHKLWLLFSEEVLVSFLRQQALPVWGKTRPATLLWLVVDDQKQRILIGNNTPHPGRTYIEQHAHERGLPFRLPLLDLADQSKLQVTDVWGNFEDTILDASKRYQTESTLVGRVYLNFNKTWHTRWTLYSAGQRQDWEVNNSMTLDEAVKEGLSLTAEALSVRFAQVNTAETNAMLSLQVKNITNLKAYNQVVDYLQNLSMVSEVQAYQVNKDNVIFHISSHSGRLGVAQAIALGHVLVADDMLPVVVAGINTEAATNTSGPLQVDLIYKRVP